MISVQFRYLTGLTRKIFLNARLIGTWDHAGRLSQSWSEAPMVDFTAEDGCPAFATTVLLDESEVGRTFRWTVRVTTASVTDVSGVPTEVNDSNSTDRVRLFTLRSLADRAGVTQIEDYYFTYTRRLGARKFFTAGQPDLRFAVWAPNAQQLDVVFGQPANGYVADDGDGIDPSRAPLPLVKGADGIWETRVVPGFAAFEGLPYMYRLTNAEGRTVYRTDIFSRQQIGRGTENPRGLHWTGGPGRLDGTKSCSLIVSLDTVSQELTSPDGRPSAFAYSATRRCSS